MIWTLRLLERKTVSPVIQLDLKIDGISEEIIRGTLKQAREARIEILRKMLTCIPRPRSETSRFAPRLLRTKIDPEKIGALIGPGGKNIRAIQEDTGVTIDVDDEGNVTVASADAESARIAIGRVEACTQPYRSARSMTVSYRASETSGVR